MAGGQRREDPRFSHQPDELLHDDHDAQRAKAPRADDDGRIRGVPHEEGDAQPLARRPAPGTPESSYDTAYASGHSTNDSAHCTLIANTSANATLVAMAAARGMRCGSVRAMFPLFSWDSQRFAAYHEAEGRYTSVVQTTKGPP